jgi:hypothetical protein
MVLRPVRAQNKPVPLRTLTNDFKDCKLIKLDPAEAGSPLVVLQEGCAPNDLTCKSKMFYLQRDGMWIDEIAHSTLSDRDAGLVVFETPADVIGLLSQLFGKPKVREIHATEADVENYVARMQKVKSPEAALRDFLARYRAAGP